MKKLTIDFNTGEQTLSDLTAEEIAEVQSRPAPTQEEIQQALLLKLDEHIDNVAKAKGYDNRITCALRAGYANYWQQEGIAFGTWMDGCYMLAYRMQAEVIAGTRPISTVEELLLAMPIMVWPV